MRTMRTIQRNNTLINEFKTVALCDDDTLSDVFCLHALLRRAKQKILIYKN